MPENLYQNPGSLFKESIPRGKTTWKSPSNIALVKYWGKRDVQIPMNPSVSFTLSESATTTTVSYGPAKDEFDLKFYFNGVRNKTFEAKTKSFFLSVTDIFPFIKQLDFVIESANSFPHSAGIASSASGMSALALALCDIEKQYFGLPDEIFFKKASYVARLGSGSACRSVYGGTVVWGETEKIEGSSNLYGIAVNEMVHPDFFKYHDTILLVDAAEKKVSSRAGHSLMNTNPFAKKRFEQAHENIGKLMDVMKAGDKEEFIKIVESEALTLHAMMMTSMPYYILMKPGTLNIIDKVFHFREETGIPVCFTLDAGPNVHLLYPDENKSEILDFIERELKLFLSDRGMIHDHVGQGPKKIE
jgi:diphosphomevalonate decarboxylase